MPAAFSISGRGSRCGGRLPNWRAAPRCPPICRCDRYSVSSRCAAKSVPLSQIQQRGNAASDGEIEIELVRRNVGAFGHDSTCRRACTRRRPCGNLAGDTPSSSPVDESSIRSNSRGNDVAQIEAPAAGVTDVEDPFHLGSRFFRGRRNRYPASRSRDGSEPPNRFLSSVISHRLVEIEAKSCKRRGPGLPVPSSACGKP